MLTVHFAPNSRAGRIVGYRFLGVRGPGRQGHDGAALQIVIL